MNQRVFQKHTINCNITSFRNEWQTFNDNEINDSSCCQKPDNLSEQPADNYIYMCAQLVHEDKVKDFNQSNIENDYLKTIDQPGNGGKDYLQLIGQGNDYKKLPTGN